MNTADPNAIALITGTIILLVLIICVTVLSWHGTIGGDAAIGFYSGLSLAGIIGGVQHAGVRAGARAARGPSQ